MRRLLSMITLLAATAVFCATASAATRPTLGTVGMPTGVIAGHSMPYIETKTVGHLRVGYAAHLPAGTRLQLLSKRTNGAFRALRTSVRLTGGHATVPITEPGIGGPVYYAVAVVSGGRRVAISKSVDVYWTSPPGGIFVLGAEGGGSAYTSLTVASESCATERSLCKGDSNSEQSFLFSAQSGTAPVPPGWSVALFYNGKQLCTSTSIQGSCSARITFPAVSVAEVSTRIIISAEAISPHGAVTTANYYVTVYA